jgi:hypothetical protein
VGKSLEMSSEGLGFEQLMKILVSTPKEKIEKPKSKSRRAKRGTLSPTGNKR